jgi:pimeloyl-ACP methyl ester carboxylesterase
MGWCPGFRAALRATLDRRYTSSGPIDAPVSIAFGGKDLLLLRRQSRHLDQLPAHTIVRDLPGCGHVPMNDDPHAVASLITASAATPHTPRPAYASSSRRRVR